MGVIIVCFTGKLVVFTDNHQENRKKRKREASIPGTAETKRADAMVIQSTRQLYHTKDVCHYQ